MTLRQVPALSFIVYPNSRLNTLHVFSNYRTLRLLSSLLRLRSRKFYDTHIYYSDRSFIISVTEVTYFCVSPLSRQCSGRVSEWHWQVNWLCSNNVWHTSRLQTQCWPPVLTGPIIASARWTPWHCCGAFRFPETCIDSKLNTTVPHCQLIPTTSRQIALTGWQRCVIKK